MNNKIVVSIDLMGGDYSPLAPVKALELIQETLHYSNCSFILHGNSDAKKLLESSNISKDLYIFNLTNTEVSADDNPLDIMRGKKNNSSMQLSIEDVSQKRAHVAVSSGNTGALMALSIRILGCINGIKRPAIVGTIPTKRGKCVMLDLGGNLECDEKMLLQFALMGSCFAKIILSQENTKNINDNLLNSHKILNKNNFHDKNEEHLIYNIKQNNDISDYNPTVALLNVGVESNKGRNTEKKAFDLLQKSNLNFIGCIEGHHIIEGNADVIVTDGYTGNVVLKSAEGVSNYIRDILKLSVEKNLISKIGGFFLSSSIKQNMEKIRPDKNNGAMFVGLNGIIVKSHGGSKSEGIANAIKTAIMLAENHVNERIINEINCIDFIDKIKNSSVKLLNMLRFNDTPN